MSSAWKKYKGWLITGAAIFGLHQIMAPADQELDDTKSYEPNSIQQEFMRLAAQKYDYVALGDTDHRRKEVALFAISAPTVKAISEGGDKHFFLEVAPARQEYIDAVSTGDLKGYNHAGSSMWICNDQIKDRLNENFTNVLSSNPDVRFIAADQRHDGTGKTSQSLQMTWLINVPLSIYHTVYGCVDTPAFYPAMLIGQFTGLEEEMGKEISDDTKTASYILSFEGGGTIFYGAGHYENDIDDNAIPMTRLFKQAGQSVAVINIYADDEQRNDRVSKQLHAGAYLYVTPTADNPDGIYTNDPDLQALHEQARQNIANRALPAPRLVPEV